MQLQFEKKVLSCLSQAVRSVKDLELTQEVRLTEDMPDASRVLAGWGQVILRGKEWQGSQIAAAGGVQATVLYAPEDGTEPRVVETWIPFQIKWDAANAEREGPMRILPLLCFVDGRNLSARKILIRTGLSCLCEGLYEKVFEVFTPAAIPEDVELLRRCYPVRLPRESGEKAFTLEETLDAGAIPVRELLSYTLQPEISEARISGDKIALRGVGKLHLVYRCREGRLRTRNFEVPFSQLGELEHHYDHDAEAHVMVAVTGLELDMEEENLALKCGLAAQYLISDRTMVDLVEDAYSTRREVGLRQDELHLPVILDDVLERVSAQAGVQELMPEVVDTAFWPGFPRMNREGDRVEAELPGRFQLLGYDTEGTLRAVTGLWEGKTGLNADAAGKVDGVVRPVGEPQWIATGNGMEIRGDVEVQMTTICRRGMPMITGLELGEIRELDPQRPSLILCRRGKRGLWEVAKGSGSSIEAIRAANGLDEDPDETQMLLIPVS